MRAPHGLLLAALVAALGVIPASWAQTPPAPVREITKIAGEVYRFRNANHYSVFAVTPAGVIATDPINADAARWLRAEITRRFNQPVRYLVYSHDHADHISGGEVFADTAVVVAHDGAKAAIVGERRPTAAMGSSGRARSTPPRRSWTGPSKPKGSEYTVHVTAGKAHSHTGTVVVK
jgi:glyoxylase-like metal-dependent hydrolase (beta-lactamase superfamily II)